jgi:exodeoxyribonuclease V gamma subunit
VMVPDIEVYTPHIQAVFGLLENDDPRHIPFSVADRGQRDFDPLIGALETLLALPQSRLTVSDVLDLLEVPALRARFGIDTDDLPKLRTWISGANIRWGLHAEQRASLGLPQTDDENAPNSWAFGLRRMLLGYAAGDKAGAWRDIEPYAEIGGLDAALLGPLTQLIDALDSTWKTLRQPATVEVWCARLRALKADFFAPGDSEDAYTLERLDAALEAWRDACDEAALTGELPLSIVADYWLSQFEGGGLSQRFFAGAVTFATLMPMRAIPFRQVCLLGMNDGDYPRNRMPLDFDLMRRNYRPGDRSRREDDRYLFLEALLSAREHLHVSWVGRSVNDNTTRPPSVLVGQLLDHLKAGWRLDDAAANKPEALLDALTVDHRLQPFSPAYFPAHPGESKLFTYAGEWSQSAPRALTEDAVSAAPESLEPLEPLEREEPLSIRELADFLKDPVKSFFRQRLRVTFDTEDAASDNHEPFEVDALETWQLQHELIRAQTAALERGDDDLLPAALERLARMHRSGDLAAGGFGEVIADDLMEPMADLFDRYRAQLERWPTLLDEQFELRVDGHPRGLTIEDWLANLRIGADGTHGRVFLDPGNLIKDRKYRGERIIAYWVGHLAAQLAVGAVTTVIVGKVGSVELTPVAQDVARTSLLTLLGTWDDGMRRPLPLAVKTAFAWLRKRPASVVLSKGRATEALDEAAHKELIEAYDAARVTYEGAGGQQQGECDTNLYLRRVFPSFNALFANGEFDELAVALLLPLHRAIPASPSKAKGAPAAANAGDAQ